MFGVDRGASGHTLGMTVTAMKRGVFDPIFCILFGLLPDLFEYDLRIYLIPCYRE